MSSMEYDSTTLASGARSTIAHGFGSLLSNPSLHLTALPVGNNAKTAEPVDRSFSMRRHGALSDPSTHPAKSSMEYDAAMLASVARASSSRSMSKPATKLKMKAPKMTSPKNAPIESITIFNDTIDGIPARPRRSNAGTVNKYNPELFHANKQGTKRSRLLSENNNINANRGNDDDSNGSDSTPENEFQG